MLKHNMSEVGKIIYKNVMDYQPVNTRCLGSIINYDHIKKTASIKAYHPVTGDLCYYHDVKIQDINRGLETVSLKHGDIVSVEFVSPLVPIVTSVFAAKNKKEDKYVKSGPQIARSVGRNT